jgi:hypothetical protein
MEPKHKDYIETLKNEKRKIVYKCALQLFKT